MIASVPISLYHSIWKISECHHKNPSRKEADHGPWAFSLPAFICLFIGCWLSKLSAYSMRNSLYTAWEIDEEHRVIRLVHIALSWYDMMGCLKAFRKWRQCIIPSSNIFNTRHSLLFKLNLTKVPFPSKMKYSYYFEVWLDITNAAILSLFPHFVALLLQRLGV